MIVGRLHKGPCEATIVGYHIHTYGCSETIARSMMAEVRTSEALIGAGAVSSDAGNTKH